MCSGPGRTAHWAFTSKLDPRETDQQYAQLVMSGLVQACMDTIETADRCENRPAYFAKVLFTTAAEKEICWQIAGYFNDNESRTSLVQLAFLKMALHAIRFLGRSERCNEEKTTVSTLRLLWRTLSEGAFFTSLNTELIWMGAIEARWERAATSAKSDCDAGRPMSRFIRATALKHILEPPSSQDQALLRWILRPDVFAAINGWIRSTCCRRSPEVAAKANSWKLVHELLLVGHKSTLDNANTTSFDQEIKIAVMNLMGAPMQQRDGSTSPMPRAYLLCAVQEQDGTSMHSLQDTLILWQSLPKETLETNS